MRLEPSPRHSSCRSPASSPHAPTAAGWEASGGGGSCRRRSPPAGSASAYRPERSASKTIPPGELWAATRRTRPRRSGVPARRENHDQEPIDNDAAHAQRRRLANGPPPNCPPSPSLSISPRAETAYSAATMRAGRSIPGSTVTRNAFEARHLPHRLRVPLRLEFNMRDVIQVVAGATPGPTASPGPGGYDSVAARSTAASRTGRAAAAAGRPAAPSVYALVAARQAARGNVHRGALHRCVSVDQCAVLRRRSKRDRARAPAGAPAHDNARSGARFSARRCASSPGASTLIRGTGSSPAGRCRTCIASCATFGVISVEGTARLPRSAHDLRLSLQLGRKTRPDDARLDGASRCARRRVARSQRGGAAMIRDPSPRSRWDCSRRARGRHAHVAGGSAGVTVDINLTLNARGRRRTARAAATRRRSRTSRWARRFIHEHRQLHAYGHAHSRRHAFPDGLAVRAVGADAARGTTLSGGFSSGALQPGSSSQTITADRAGTYLFGCFFHYGAPMRAAIVAQ